MIFFLLCFYLTQSVYAGTPMGSPDVLVEQIALGSGLPATVAGKYLAIDPYGQALYYVSSITSSSVTVTKTGNPASTPITSGAAIPSINGPTGSTFAGLTISSDGNTLYTGWKKNSTTLSLQSSALSTGAILPTFHEITTSDSLIALLAVDNTAHSDIITSILYVVTENAIWAYGTNNTNTPLWTIPQYSFLPKITASVVGGDNLYLACKSDGTYEGYNAGYIACLPNLPSYTGSNPPGYNPLNPSVLSNPLKPIAGGATSAGFKDGNGTVPRFRKIQGLAYFGKYLYVADTGNNAIRRVDVTNSSHPVITIAGGLQQPSGPVSAITSGTANQAVFDTPMNCVIDSGGQTLYFMAGGAGTNSYHTSPTDLTLQRVWMAAYDPNVQGSGNDAKLRGAVMYKNPTDVTSSFTFHDHGGPIATPAAYDSNGWTSLHILASIYQECYTDYLINSSSWKWNNWKLMWAAIRDHITGLPQQKLGYFLHPNQWGDTAHGDCTDISSA
ncbi:hypothetical protein [Candidatus Finniella inopinata]|uniref:Uncharacterized protein n=1 Tax=Candidatus Finniella inopinata TaxID=1696036 RepID=A0A4Q7DIN5_9PROT|nr:hypothetical protein [Candidatus Finniella inopinata]RZI46831.1 hypothetical protein EQU50_00990 [Candidatus Finniella inopinata]